MSYSNSVPVTDDAMDAVSKTAPLLCNDVDDDTIDYEWINKKHSGGFKNNWMKTKKVKKIKKLKKQKKQKTYKTKKSIL